MPKKYSKLYWIRFLSLSNKVLNISWAHIYQVLWFVLQYVYNIYSLSPQMMDTFYWTSCSCSYLGTYNFGIEGVTKLYHYYCPKIIGYIKNVLMKMWFLCFYWQTILKVKMACVSRHRNGINTVIMRRLEHQRVGLWIWTHYMDRKGCGAGGLSQTTRSGQRSSHLDFKHVK